MACGFSYWEKMSILQIFFVNCSFKKLQPNPQCSSLFGLHLVPTLHNALLLFQLPPLGFHSNKVVEIQCLEIHVKGKPLEAALCMGGSIFI